MSAFGKYLRKGTDFYTHWCPGCDSAHVIYVGEGSGPRWSFNGDPDKPHFDPSVRIYQSPGIWNGVAVPERTFCHYFIHNGAIDFCGDCEHKLSGKQGVPLVEWAAHKDYGWPDGDVCP